MIIGSRDSQLAQIQAREVQSLFQKDLGLSSELHFMKTVGDKDLTTDLRVAPADFFTRDLDEALRAQTIDCAIHSAKDLPPELPEDMDFFYIPNHEDARDALVWREGIIYENITRLGSSSERRNAWLRSHFPNGQILPIRGSIPSRLEQLHAGDYDALIVAVAALNRLNIKPKNMQLIPLQELTPPEAQGYLAITFLKTNTRIQKIRQAYVSPVIFAGAGPHDSQLLTLGCIDALRECDVCIYDVLGAEPHAFLSPNAKTIFVGKRMNGHAMKQNEITQLIVNYACKGFKVVRLKGGDPGIFGRLAEEVEALENHQLPYRIIPGISAFSAGSLSSGYLLTRRGVSRGFAVLTPRSAHENTLHVNSKQELQELPRVYFMSVAESGTLFRHLQGEGFSGDTPCCALFNISHTDETVLDGTLETLAEKIDVYRAQFEEPPPGLIMVGATCASQYRFPPIGLLGGLKILLTCSHEVMSQGIASVRHYNGIPIPFPCIEVLPVPNITEQLADISQFDYLTIASPSVAQILMNHVADVRVIPKLIICGTGTAKVFERHGIHPDLMPTCEFGNEAMKTLIQQNIRPEDKVLQLKTNRASGILSETLRTQGCSFESRVIAENTPTPTRTKCPEFDFVFFASGSAVKAFAEKYPNVSVRGKSVVIGGPTAKVFQEVYTFEPSIIGTEATIHETIHTLACAKLREYLTKNISNHKKK